MTKPLLLTAQVAAWIKALHRDHPTMKQHQIAALVGQNQGRICEVLKGQRFGDVPPAYPTALGAR